MADLKDLNKYLVYQPVASFFLVTGKTNEVIMDVLEDSIGIPVSSCERPLL